LQWEDWRDVNLENEVQLIINMIGAIRRLKTRHSIRDKPEGELVTVVSRVRVE
jgi:hypothetical protein